MGGDVHDQPVGHEAILRPGLNDHRLKHVGDVLAPIGAGLQGLADVLPLDDLLRAGPPGEQALDRLAQDVVTAVFQPVQRAGVGKDVVHLLQRVHRVVELLRGFEHDLSHLARGG